MNAKFAMLLVALALPVAGLAADDGTRDSGTAASPSSGGSGSSPGTYVKDSLITAKVKAALARDKEVTARNIKVETDAQGMVTLSGDARTQAEADRAVSIARSVDGVTSVTNNIRVP